MDTLTTIENVRRTDGGAYAVTFLGDQVAGTFNDDIGKRAQNAALEDQPVQVKLRKDPSGKLFIEKLEIAAPEELGGISDEEQKELRDASIATAAEKQGEDESHIGGAEEAPSDGSEPDADAPYYEIERIEVLSKVSTKTLGDKLNEVIQVVNQLSRHVG